MSATPAVAFCAVGPDGKIDIDLLRRSDASAGFAVAAVKGIPWKQMRTGLGWRMATVRLVEVGSADDTPEAVSAPAAAKRGPARKKAAAPDEPQRVRMLKCGEVP